MAIPATPENLATLNDYLAQRGGEPVEVPTSPEPEAPVAQDFQEEDLPEVIDDETQAAIAALEDDADEEGASPAPSVDLVALARHLGLEQADFRIDEEGRVKLRTKVDGQDSEVSLGELRKGYQLQRHFTQQQENFLRERAQWEQQRQATDQQYQAQMALAYEVLSGQEAELKREYTRNWSELRRDDPAEYAAQVAEYNQRLNQIRSRQNGLQEEFQRRQFEYQQQWQAHQQDLLAREAPKLVEALGLEPGKATEEVRQQRLNSIGQYLERQGFAPQDLSGIMDHRAYVIVDKARRYDELMAKVSKAKSKLQSPSPVPEGNRAVSLSAAAATDKKVAVLEKRALETGTRDDQRAAFKAVLAQQAKAKR